MPYVMNEMTGQMEWVPDNFTPAPYQPPQYYNQPPAAGGGNDWGYLFGVPEAAAQGQGWPFDLTQGPQPPGAGNYAAQVYANAGLPAFNRGQAIVPFQATPLNQQYVQGAQQASAQQGLAGWSPPGAMGAGPNAGEPQPSPYNLPAMGATTPLGGQATAAGGGGLGGGTGGQQSVEQYLGVGSPEWNDWWIRFQQDPEHRGMNPEQFYNLAQNWKPGAENWMENVAYDKALAEDYMGASGKKSMTGADWREAYYWDRSGGRSFGGMPQGFGGGGGGGGATPTAPTPAAAPIQPLGISGPVSQFTLPSSAMGQISPQARQNLFGTLQGGGWNPTGTMGDYGWNQWGRSGAARPWFENVSDRDVAWLLGSWGMGPATQR